MRGFDPIRVTCSISPPSRSSRNCTYLPVLVDPSHATGRADLVVPMGDAAIAAGADGLLVEVHQHPEVALCDAKQAITPTQLARLITQATAVRAALG